MAETNQNDAAGAGDLVCVTGASGFIGTHVVRELLARGYRVRATVRDASDQKKTAHLLKIAEGATYPLEIVSANLMKPGSFDQAFEGCVGVFHVASAVRLAAPNPQQDIIDPAVEGTKNVLASIDKTPSVKTLVQTSSIAAILSNNKPASHVYTEKDWNEDASVAQNPYGLAKKLAERACGEYNEQRQEKLRMVHINPVVVFGPVYTKQHVRSSPAFIADLIKGAFPACPNLHFGVVDVRDVARVHVDALERPDVEGRFILHNRGMWMVDMAHVMKQKFPELKLPLRRLPNLLMYAAAIFDKRLTFTFLRNNLGKVSKIDNRRVQEVMGLKFTPVEQSIYDTARSLLDGGFVTPKR